MVVIGGGTADYVMALLLADSDCDPPLQATAPFASMLDGMAMTQFVDSLHRRLDGEDVEVHSGRYFVAKRLAAD